MYSRYLCHDPMAVRSVPFHYHVAFLCIIDIIAILHIRVVACRMNQKIVVFKSVQKSSRLHYYTMYLPNADGNTTLKIVLHCTRKSLHDPAWGHHMLHAARDLKKNPWYRKHSSHIQTFKLPNPLTSSNSPVSLFPLATTLPLRTACCFGIYTANSRRPAGLANPASALYSWKLYAVGFRVGVGDAAEYEREREWECLWDCVE
jgi:hypothetical protein